jgi:hypothetical protein
MGLGGAGNNGERPKASTMDRIGIALPFIAFRDSSIVLALHIYISFPAGFTRLVFHSSCLHGSGGFGLSWTVGGV